MKTQLQKTCLTVILAMFTVLANAQGYEVVEVEVVDSDYDVCDTVVLDEEEDNAALVKKTKRFLEEIAEGIREGLPQDSGMGKAMTSVALDDNYFVYTITCDDYLMDVISLLDNNEFWEATLEKFKKSHASDDSVQHLVKSCLQGNMGILYKFVGESSGKSVIVPISVSELRDIVNSRNFSEEIVEAARQVLPQGPGIAMTSVDLDDNYFVFTITCDDNLLDASLFDNDSFREMTLEKLKETYASSENIEFLVRLCLQANVGVLYKYVGAPSGKSVGAPITVSELQSIIKPESVIRHFSNGCH